MRAREAFAVEYHALKCCTPDRGPAAARTSLGQVFLDIMAETQNGLILDIEAQSGHFKEYSNRALRYANALLEKSLKRGAPYDTMEKSIVVTIADGRPYMAADKLHCIFDIREREAGVPMTDRLTLRSNRQAVAVRFA